MSSPDGTGGGVRLWTSGGHSSRDEHDAVVRMRLWGRGNLHRGSLDSTLSVSVDSGSYSDSEKSSAGYFLGNLVFGGLPAAMSFSRTLL